MISSHFSDEGPQQGEGYGYEAGGDRKRRRFAPYEGGRGPASEKRVCLDNLNGVCRRGEDCKFAHEEQERQVCRDFLNNVCRRGSDCRFSHDRENDKGRKICLHYLNGKCSMGAECKFVHKEVSALSGNEVCKDWLNGRCDRGHRCRFQHPPDMGSERLPDDGRDVCRDYLNFKCDRGRSCKFYHPPRDERRPRNGGWSRYDDFSPRRRYRERDRDVPGGPDFVAVCRDFLSGNCYNDRCNFVHLGSDGRRSLGRPRSPPPPYRRELPPWDRGFSRRDRWDRDEVCKDFLNGKCRRGRDCKFRHPADRRQGPEVCREFLNGRCTRGDACKYEHDEKRKEAERRSDVCREFLNGRCSRGAACKYIHDEEVLAREKAEGGQRCRLFQRGRCHKSDCRFAHVDENGEILNPARFEVGKDFSA